MGAQTVSTLRAKPSCALNNEGLTPRPATEPSARASWSAAVSKPSRADKLFFVASSSSLLLLPCGGSASSLKEFSGDLRPDSAAAALLDDDEGDPNNLHVFEPLAPFASCAAFSVLSSHASFSGNSIARIIDGDIGRSGGAGGPTTVDDGPGDSAAGVVEHSIAGDNRELIAGNPCASFVMLAAIGC